MAAPGTETINPRDSSNLIMMGSNLTASMRILPLFWLALACLAWGKDEVRFELVVEPAEVGVNSRFDATVKASIEEGWHLYSLTQPPGGPIRTTISVTETGSFAQAGEVRQPEPRIQFDPNFGINAEFFDGKVDFLVPVQVKPGLSESEEALQVQVRFMVCSDTLCLPPQTKTLEAPVVITEAAAAAAPARAEPPGAATPPIEGVEAEGGDSNDSGAAAAIPLSLFAYLGFSMTWGALALLTPCVFPMIPITVSYFTKREAVSRKRALSDAALYSLGIVLTFTLLGFALTFLFGLGGINRLAASPLVNIGIAAVFLVFALSLFGALEIRLPSSWTTYLDKKASATGGVIGILLMALTFSLVSFTCTVPFVGTLMVAAVQGDFLWSLLGITAFAVVFATPFFLLALFPSWLQALPRSGSWLSSVKVTMGFLELAAALKFISNVDLVYQRELITRPLFITVWLSIALVTCFYLLGWFHFEHESPNPPLGVVRILSVIFFGAVAIYLFRGLFGFPLGELDAFLPPRDYGNPASIASLGGHSESDEPDWLTNYQAGLDLARRENRPLFVDFTGYTCTNCRWMESNVFTRPEVRKRLAQFVLVRLYTDGPELEHEENLRFEEERFGTIALPYYAVMSPQDEIIVTFPGLTRVVEDFVGFLDRGLLGVVSSKGRVEGWKLRTERLNELPVGR